MGQDTSQAGGRNWQFPCSNGLEVIKDARLRGRSAAEANQ